jgi:hypothetical protein
MSSVKAAFNEEAWPNRLLAMLGLLFFCSRAFLDLVCPGVWPGIGRGSGFVGGVGRGVDGGSFFFSYLTPMFTIGGGMRYCILRDLLYVGVTT